MGNRRRLLARGYAGGIIGALNHAQHENLDPIDNKTREKDRIREKIKNNSKYKKKILDEIMKDGKMDFTEAYYWYVYGDGTAITVDASKLDLGQIDITGKKVGDKWPIQTLGLSGNYGVGLVYGNITVTYKGKNTFSISPDTYDFDIHTNNFFNLHTIIRNVETIGASILHGSGTPFDIIFKGFYKNK